MMNTTGHILRSQKNAPHCPLKELINEIPSRFHGSFRGITVSEELGLVSKQCFANLDMLNTYLGAYCIGNIEQPLPYVAQLCSVDEVTIYTLLSHCGSRPDKSELKEILQALPRGMK